MTKSKSGFTIVELLIVIVVIAILAAITTVAYNGIQDRTRTAKREHDLTTYYKAILLARENAGKTLYQITGSTWSVQACAPNGGVNTGNKEPKDLPKTHRCWIDYYNNLTRIGDAANVDLSGLRDGDGNGNPYTLDENEGENCNDDSVFYYKHDGTAANVVGRKIPRTKSC